MMKEATDEMQQQAVRQCPMKAACLPGPLLNLALVLACFLAEFLVAVQPTCEIACHGNPPRRIAEKRPPPVVSISPPQMQKLDLFSLLH
jgi:hypothetical protein